MTAPHLRAPPMLASGAGSAAVSPAPSAGPRRGRRPGSGRQAPRTHPHSRGRSPYPHRTPYTMETAVWPERVLSDAKASPRKFCGCPSSGRGGEGRQGRESEDGAKLPASTVASYLGQAVRGQRREGLLPAAGVLADG